MRNPYSSNLDEIHFGNSKLNEELIELSSDENLRIRFQENACDIFLISIKSEYPELSKKAVLMFLLLNNIFNSNDNKKQISLQIKY